MTACKYWDCGWCYAPNYLKTNAINSTCVNPYKCPISPLSEPVQYETPMTEIEELKAQIKILEKKVALLEEIEKTPIPKMELLKDGSVYCVDYNNTTYYRQHYRHSDDWIKDLREFVCEPPDPSEFMEAPICATKGTYWVTNGTETRMIIGDIPEGWWKGRGKVLSDEGKKRCIKHLKESNPNAKKYKIVYRDGTEEIVNQLSTWARNNGHKYTNIKSIVHRSKYKKEKQFECYNSLTYYIKEIVPL